MRRWARELTAFVDHRLTAVRLTGRLSHREAELVGQRIVAAHSHGKHLLIAFSEGSTLHCHAMLWGSWQFGERGLRLRKPERRVRVRLTTAFREAVFFNGPLVELLSPEEILSHHSLAKLGPDLLWPDFDRAEAARRVRAQGDRPIGDALLDQTVVAGIGNIYKSEGLHLAGIDPRRPARSVRQPELERLWDILLPVMEAASHPGALMFPLPPEHAERGHRRWVYRRRGQPCLSCGRAVEMQRQGVLARSSYFCPSCQTAGSPTGVPILPA